MTGTVMMMVLMLMTSTVSFEKETPTSKYANDNHSDSNDDNTDDDGDGDGPHLESHHDWLKISTFLMRAFPVNCLSCIFRNIWMIMSMISNFDDHDL